MENPKLSQDFTDLFLELQMLEAHLKILFAQLNSIRKSLIDTESLRFNIFFWAYHNYINDSFKKSLQEKEQILLVKIEEIQKEKEAKTAEVKEVRDSELEGRKMLSDTLRHFY